MRWIAIAVAAVSTAITGILSADWNELGDPVAVDASPPPSGPTRSVVLVTIDGVRPREIFIGPDSERAGRRGLPAWARASADRFLPNLHRLFIEGGAALGDPRFSQGISASGPRYVSLPGYLEIMTGSPATCTSNDCIPKPTETLADAVALAEGASRESMVFGSWEVIQRAASGEHNWVETHAGRDASESMAPYPGNGEYRPDRATVERAMAALRRDRPRFLWISLGDTDEWAHRGDYLGYLGALRDADRAVGELAAALAQEGNGSGDTMLIVTTDHGRDANFADHGGPDSAAVWLLARGPGVAPVGSIEATKPRYLRDLAPTVRAVLDLPSRPESSGEVIDEILRPTARIALRVEEQKSPN